MFLRVCAFAKMKYYENLERGESRCVLRTTFQFNTILDIVRIITCHLKI